MYKKKFRTLDEQIEILKNKGLSFKDEELAKSILLKENYFFINSYREIFYNEDRKFIEGTMFSELHALFLFDRELRNVIFKEILVIENNMKSMLSYHLSKKYGYKETDYLNFKNFTSDPDKKKQVADVIRKMRRQIRSNGKQHRATLHYINNYGYIPLWVLVKVLSFGIISELYCILKNDEQDEIAKEYNVSKAVLITYLSILSNYRNLCAHEDMVYENRTQKYINNTRYHIELNIPVKDGEPKYGKNDLFSLIIILKQMLSDEQFVKMINEIDILLKELNCSISSIPQEKILNTMGFPENWKEIGEL